MEEKQTQNIEAEAEVGKGGASFCMRWGIILLISLVGAIIIGLTMDDSAPSRSTVAESPNGYTAEEYAQAKRIRGRALRAHKSNLERIVAALKQYGDANNGVLPAAYTVDEAGRPLHSWRVAILPYLGEEEAKLYAQIRLDEPWNSEWNSRFHSQRPNIFACPNNVFEAEQIVLKTETATEPKVVCAGILSALTKAAAKSAANGAKATAKTAVKVGGVVGAFSAVRLTARPVNLERSETTYSVVLGENCPFQADGVGRALDEISAAAPLVVERKKPICWMNPDSDVSRENWNAEVGSAYFTDGFCKATLGGTASFVSALKKSERMKKTKTTADVAP